MKKVIFGLWVLMLLLFLYCFCLVGCDDNENKHHRRQQVEESLPTTEQLTPEPTDVPQPEPTEEPVEVKTRKGLTVCSIHNGVNDSGITKFHDYELEETGTQLIIKVTNRGTYTYQLQNVIRWDEEVEEVK